MHNIHSYIIYRPLKEANNLATICRRLEKYRVLKKYSFNTLICCHCAKRTTVTALCEQGFGLSSIFGRSLCPAVPIIDGNEPIVRIFSCPDCTKKCRRCKPLVSNKEALNNYHLVYYLHPAHDPRNHGGFLDLNMPTVKLFAMDFY